MKRKHIYALMLTLLTLLPAGLLAQSVTGMQYWFDDGSKHTISISEGENTEHLSTSGLSVGIHTLYYRFTQSGGDIYEDFEITDPETGEVTQTRRYYADLDYSPVYSVRFFKHDPSEGSTVEYWFDKKSNHATKDISGQEDETVTLDLKDNSMFPLGFHQLNMRFSTPGKSPSAIYTADVMKFSAGSDYLEYWVDDDQQNSKKLKTGAGNASVTVTTAMPLDLKDVSPGLHHLYFRTCDANGVAGSAVYSAIIFRHASEGSQIEYWFDDDASTIQKKQFAEAYQNGAGYTLELSNDIFPQGLHQLNIRVSTKNSGKSAIYSMPVIKMAPSSFNTVEFWLDDDRENVLTLSGSLSSSGVAIVGDLDFSNADPGMHYLHYRAIGKDGKPSNAIGEWPVMVKSRYNTDGSDVLLTSYSVLVDNEEKDAYNFVGRKKESEIPYLLDASDLSVGTHELMVRTWNSLGTNAIDKATFTVGEIPPPTLALTAEENNGKVTLKLNSVPNDESYRIIREDANGAKAKVASRLSCYPGDITLDDEPAVGTYSYYADCAYTDSKGVRKALHTEKVSVTVTEAQPEVEENGNYVMGYVMNEYGIMRCYQENPERYNAICVGVYKGEELSSKAYIYDGRFMTKSYPVGTKLTLKMLNYYNPNWVFEPVEVVVGEKPTETIMMGVAPDMMEGNSKTYDLELASDVDWMSGNFVFRVKNLSPKKKWVGKIRFRAINDGNYDKMRRSERTPENVAQQPQQTEQIWFTSETEETIEIEANESKQIYLSLNDLFPDDKRDYYYFYFESEGRLPRSSQEYDVVKPIAVGNTDLNVTSFPFKRQIDKSSLANAVELQRLKDAEYAANLILAICSTINGIDKRLGEVKSALEGVDGQYAQLVEDMDGAKINSIIQGKSMEEIMQSGYMKALINKWMANCGIIVIDHFREELVADILSYSKSVSEYLGTAVNLLQQVRDYEKVQNMTEYEKVFNSAHGILNIIKTYSSSPVITILSTYLDVTEKIVNYALKLGKDYYSYSAPHLLFENIPETESDKQKYEFNRHIDFKLRVSPKHSVSFFNFAKRGNRGKDIIKSAVVKVNNKKDYPEQVATIFLEPVPVSDGVMFRQTGLDNGGGGIGNGHLDAGIPFERMWMEIKWKNGRMTIIPLLDEGSGIIFDQPNIWGGKTYQYTVSFESGATSSHFDNMADILKIKD